MNREVEDMPAPVALTGLVLETPLLAETTAFYVDQFGLSKGSSTEDEVTLMASAAPHPCLTLRRGPAARLVGLSFAYGDAASQVAAHEAARLEGLQPRKAGRGFAIDDPDGREIQFHVGLDASRLEGLQASDRPLFLSHAVVNSADPSRLVAFYRDILGFEVSDHYEKGLLTFLKCAQPQHHCLGVSPAEAPGLNHFAMDCGSLDGLMRGLSRMKALGHEPVWGPGRHGPGGNVFCYFEDPAGFVPEYTCDVLQIEDGAAWTPTEWKRTPENANVWLTGGPTPRAIALMSGTAPQGQGPAVRPVAPPR